MGVSREDHDGEVIAASLVEPTCFESVFDRHFDAILRYLAIRVGANAADDLAATVFVEAFVARSRFDFARPDAAPWLYGIATNLVHRHRRQERRALRAFVRAAHQATTSADDGLADGHLDDRLAALARRSDLGRALRGLRAGERDAVVLAACTDLTYGEIAAALGVPVGTVRSRISRGRARLRDVLGEPAPPPGSEPTPAPLLEGGSRR